MFRHKGKSRNFKQNIGIASLLSLVAGIVNVVGFLAVQKLTTNVTGHFAFMVEEAIQIHFGQAFFYFLYILSFLLGAFFSNLLIEAANRINDKYIFVVPVITEAFIVLTIGLLPYTLLTENSDLTACALLFAMGLQNALVTTISNSAVRTTHLTGLFTDLGIEISQLFFFKSSQQHKKLRLSIRLRLTIITAFFCGGIIAGFMFETFKNRTLILGAFILIAGLLIDYFTVKYRLRMIRQKRSNKQIT